MMVKLLGAGTILGLRMLAEGDLSAKRSFQSLNLR